MKNLILASASVAALAIAAPAMAQNNQSNVTQGGQFNDAEVNQVGSNATATVTQTGTGAAGERMNEVLIDQSGDGAEAFVSQAGSDRNEAQVDQNGDSYASIVQDGTAQGGEIWQTGDDNEAYID
ncbi:hypothetical protein [Aurantiacibacter hainanensis]|uniref:hypothetical protein n=1 Tax=Aurantiacibacter hainanensis TaxID=3076114 RepID=UPI0030C75E2D